MADATAVLGKGKAPSTPAIGRLDFSSINHPVAPAITHRGALMKASRNRAWALGTSFAHKDRDASGFFLSAVLDVQAKI